MTTKGHVQMDKRYTLTDEDLAAINRLLELPGCTPVITRDSMNFEVGITNPAGYMPLAYGSGKTIAAAVNEAIGCGNDD